MLLSFQIPLKMKLLGMTQDLSEYNVSFQYKRCLCEVRFIGGEIRKEYNTVLKTDHFVCYGEELEFIISDKPGQYKIRDLVDNTEWNKLENYLREVANMFIRSLRNYGRVSFLREIEECLEWQTPEWRLGRWKLKAGENRTSLNEIFPTQKGLLGGLLGLEVSEFIAQPFPIITSFYLDEVIKSLSIGDRKTLPENEFLVNTDEHITLNNIRLAIIESVVALEIVLDEYLKLHFIDNIKADKELVNSFLEHEVGLTSKLFVLLKIINIGNWADMEKVRQVIKLRNKVVHDSSNVDLCDKKVIIEQIKELQLLVWSLRYEIGVIRLQKVFDEIGTRIKDKYSIDLPLVFGDKRNEIVIRFMISEYAEKFPDQQTIEDIIDDLKVFIEGWDNTFDVYGRLRIGFIGFPSGISVAWHNGSITTKTYHKIKLVQDDLDKAKYCLIF